GNIRGIALMNQSEFSGVMRLKGLEKIQLDCDPRRWRGLDDLHPSFTDFFVSFPFIDGALTTGGAAVSPFQSRVQFLPRGPRSPIMEVVDKGENLLRRRLDACGALDAERVRLSRRKA